jgi:hypothetical protein
LQKSLQQEWQFIQQVVEGICDGFSSIEKSIDAIFLPALFSYTLDDHEAGHFLCKLPVKCLGFSFRHALECKVGGLIILRHNEVNDELGNLASKAMTPSAVQVEALITKGPTADEPTALVTLPPGSRIPHPNLRKGGGDCGGLLIRGHFACGTNTIVDVRIMDMDAKSYHSKDPHKVLAQHKC